MKCFKKDLIVCFPGSENSSEVLNFPEGQELCHGGNNRSILPPSLRNPDDVVWILESSVWQLVHEAELPQVWREGAHLRGGCAGCWLGCAVKRALTWWESWESQGQRKPDLGKSE